jgi:hypothetical protein
LALVRPRPSRPLAETVALATVPARTEVRVVDVEGDWALVRTTSGDVGWMRTVVAPARRMGGQP